MQTPRWTAAADPTRRRLLIGGSGLAGLALLGGCTTQREPSPTPVRAGDKRVREVEARRRRKGAPVREHSLRVDPTDVDLGGPVARTWTYNSKLPGPAIRVTEGDILKVSVSNQLPEKTTIHWHGVALRNDMDGAPGITQKPIEPGATFGYEFAVPYPGTYFFHPHVGLQLDRGLYAPLIVEARDEPGRYDHDVAIVLDDWVDGAGRTPEDVLAELDRTPPLTPEGRPAKGHSEFLGGGAGEVDYPHYLINGRLAAAPETVTAKPGDRMRLRLINAGSDTTFRVALAGHRMTVTHTDGYPVEPIDADVLVVAMGERYDVIVTLESGVFPLVAAAEGKAGLARALVRTGPGRVPGDGLRPPELRSRPLMATDLTAAEDVRLDAKKPDRTHNLFLGGETDSYRWKINAKTYPDTDPLPVAEGERVRLKLVNQTMMIHPIHVHGHTFAVRTPDGRPGPRKDTVIVKANEALEIDLVADNPGQWLAHCHNLYHMERGMMVVLSYMR